jgi:hypothetical protein
VELAATSTTTNFNNVVFYGGTGNGNQYLNVTGAAWTPNEMVNIGFQDVSDGSASIRVWTPGTVTLTNYASGTGWLSGALSDITGNGGAVSWGPTAAEGLEASVTETPRGNLVTWSASLERRTAGYRVLRRAVRSFGGLLEEESTGSSVGGGRSERRCGPWRKVFETPARNPGGVPLPAEYRFVDPGPGKQFEYLVVEVQANGRPGHKAPTRPKGAVK